MLAFLKKIEYAIFPCQKKLDALVNANKDKADEVIHIMREYVDVHGKKPH